MLSTLPPDGDLEGLVVATFLAPTWPPATEALLDGGARVGHSGRHAHHEGDAEEEEEEEPAK